MDFTDAVIFAGAIVVIVGSGILLGIAIGRGRRKPGAGINPGKAKLYGKILATLDGLRVADDSHKRRFIDLYYLVLMQGSDRVVKTLNGYLQNATAPDGKFDASVLAASRDQVALAMRQDVYNQLGEHTGLNPHDLYSIEISHEVSSSGTPVQESPPTSEIPEPRAVPRDY